VSVFSSLSTNSAFSRTTAGPSLSRATFPDVAQISQEQNEAFEVETQTSIQNSFFRKTVFFCCQSSKHRCQSVANIAMIQPFQGPLLSTPSHFPSPSEPLKSDCNPPVGSGEKNALEVSKKLIRIQNKQGTSAWLKTAGSILLVTCRAVFLRNGRTSFS